VGYQTCNGLESEGLAVYVPREERVVLSIGKGGRERSLIKEGYCTRGVERKRGEARRG